MSQIYFIRHVETDNPNRLVGLDSPISEKGKSQLVSLGEFFAVKSLAKVFHSPLIRASETAIAVAGSRVDLLESDERLRERKWGKDDATWQEFWEILDKMSLMERYEYKPPNGESWQEFEKRTAEFWDEKAKEIDNDIAIVSHEGTMRCILAYLQRQRLGGLKPSLEWSITQNFAFGSVSVLDKESMEFEKEVFVPDEH